MNYVQPHLELAHLGAQLRDEGIVKVLGDPDKAVWRVSAYHWLARLAHGQEVTSTDLIDAVGMPPGSPNAVGAVMRAAASQGLLEPTGVYIKSTRPSCHAAVVRVWKST